MKRYTVPTIKTYNSKKNHSDGISTMPNEINIQRVDYSKKKRENVVKAGDKGRASLSTHRGGGRVVYEAADLTLRTDRWISSENCYPCLLQEQTYRTRNIRWFNGMEFTPNTTTH